MTDLFEEVLAVCLDRLEDGDSVDQCVEEYSEFPDLRETLEIAEALRCLPAPAATRGWVRGSRMRLVTNFGLRGLRAAG